MPEKNKLYYGDNYDVLRLYVRDETVDLVYLDPPFNSRQDYSVLFAEKDGSKSSAQIHAFEDTWTWNIDAERSYQHIVETIGGRIADAMRAFRTFLGTSDMMAYLAMMAPRLVELRRVLKPTGSIYLHCDPTASHYLKMLMDAVFGPQMFKNEIVWKRSHSHNSAKRYGPIHDVILYYSKSDGARWNPTSTPLDPEYVLSHYKYEEKGRRYKRQDVTGAGVRRGETGKPWRGIDPTPKARHWMRPPSELEELDRQGLIYWPEKAGAWPYLKLFLDERSGQPIQDIWSDIDPINPIAAERLGYPTQKPEALLERIIKASSSEGDLVLDPFCGCGTTVQVAQRLNRRWIGIDITHLAIGLIKKRLSDAFGPQIRDSYQVIGEPTDFAGAERLAADDKYQFQWWALGQVGARPADQKKGADRGIDGRLYFHDDESGRSKQILFSVKAGAVNPGQVRDLAGTVSSEKAEIGIFITFNPPTQHMIEAAAKASFYTSPDGSKYPRIQILTIQEILDGRQPDYPLHRRDATFKKAPRARSQSENLELPLN